MENWYYKQSLALMIISYKSLKHASACHTFDTKWLSLGEEASHLTSTCVACNTRVPYWCNILTISITIATTILCNGKQNDVHNRHIATCSPTKFHQASNIYLGIHMFSKQFDSFCYHRNHNFHTSTEINSVHNQHFATCSHTKFHQASLNSFFGHLRIQMF